MKVLLLTGYDDNLKEIGDITSRVMADYATKHGIDFLRIRQYDCNLHPSWQKSEHVARQLKAGYDRVIWLDADTVITNFDVDPFNRAWNAPVQVSRDWGLDATEDHHFSMGNFVTNKDRRGFQDFLWCQLPKYIGVWGDKPLWEQSACQAWYQEQLQLVQDPTNLVLHPAHVIKMLPRRTFNSVHASLAPSAPEPWQPGDWLCHLTGEEITNEKRMKVLRELLPNLP